MLRSFHLGYRLPCYPSSSSLCILVLNFLAPENLTHSFLLPVHLRLSFLHHSSLYWFLCFIKCLHCNQTSHTLAGIRVLMADRSAESADQDVLQHPLSHWDRRSNLLTEEEEKQITSFTIPTWRGEIKPLSAWLRRVRTRFNQSNTAKQTRPVGISVFWVSKTSNNQV